jgi:CubicO group peptidase (beta-lactamase class C family)
VLVLVACADDSGDAATAPSAGAGSTSMVTASTGTSSTVAPATSTTAPTAPTTLSLDYDFSAVSPIVGSFVDERGLNGAGLIVVDREDGVVYEEYWGEFDADRISLIASSSKMISAGVLLRLQDQGLLDINAPVAEAVEWGRGNPTITPAQLLSNSSGLVGLLPDYMYASYECQWQISGSLQECAAAIFTTSGDDADVVAPDTEFRYGGAQWQVAGGVAEAVSGTSWDQLVRETYIEPCDLETLGFNNHWLQVPPDGVHHPTAFDSDPSTLTATLNPNVEAGAYITTGDYAKLLLMHLRGGRCGDTQVLSQEALGQMHTDRIGAAYDGSATIALQPMPNMGYGMGWWIHRESGRRVDPGAYGATAWLDLEGGYGAYLVLESNMATGAELATQLYGPVEDAVGAID